MGLHKWGCLENLDPLPGLEGNHHLLDDNKPLLPNWVVATQIFFLFTPSWGRWTQFDKYFSNGLVQPPTRLLMVVRISMSFASHLDQPMILEYEVITKFDLRIFFKWVGEKPPTSIKMVVGLAGLIGEAPGRWFSAKRLRFWRGALCESARACWPCCGWCHSLSENKTAAKSMEFPGSLNRW